jgi:hypothetical protein
VEDAISISGDVSQHKVLAFVGRRKRIVMEGRGASAYPRQWIKIERVE